MPEGDRKDGSLFTPLEWRELTARYRLTARELGVARHVTDGQPEATIAGELQLSRHTVHAHIQSLKAKLRVQSRAEVIIELSRTSRALNDFPDREASSHG